jgi:hypothetical protein
MKKIDTPHRPRPSQKLTLQRETLRHLATTELARIRGGTNDVSQPCFPTITRDEI